MSNDLNKGQRPTGTPIEKRGGYTPHAKGPAPTAAPKKPTDAASSARPKK